MERSEWDRVDMSKVSTKYSEETITSYEIL